MRPSGRCSTTRTERDKGPTPTCAELGQIAGTNNYGHRVLLRRRDAGHIPADREKSPLRQGCTRDRTPSGTFNWSCRWPSGTVGARSYPQRDRDCSGRELADRVWGPWGAREDTEVASRGYSEVTKKALFALSRGQCYEPSCSELVVRMAGETPIVKVEIAHIRAAKKNGPRYDENMTEQERKSFSNLLLLCVFHHKLVDRKPTGDNYSVETLQEWKGQREGELTHDLSGLTEDDLTDILSSVLQEIISETKDELLAAIAKVENISRDSAELLRALVAETFNRPYLDADTVSLLAESARVFKNLPDYAPMLAESSRTLGYLPDYAPMLNESSRELRGLPEYISMLNKSAQGLLNLPEYAPMIQKSSETLINLPDHATMLREASRDLKETISEMHQAVYSANNAGSSKLFSRLNEATQNATSISSELAENIQDLERVAQLAQSATETRPPDRWTYIKNGLIVGTMLGSLLMASIWYLVAHAAQ